MKLNDQRGAGITDRAVKAQRELSLCIVYWDFNYYIDNITKSIKIY